MRSIMRRFWRDEGGFAFVFFLVAMPAFIGVSLLVIDIGRGNNLHFDVQRSVDALAVAAAAQLDGTDGARARAVQVLEGALSGRRPDNRSRFSEDGAILLTADNVEWAFLRSLPFSDDDAIVLEEHEATSDQDAEFIWVWAAGENAHRYGTIFPVSLALGRGTVDMAAQAVAGYTMNVCDFTPMFICNPYEHDPTVDLLTEDAESSVWRRQILMKSSEQYSEGNFGWIMSPNGPGNNELGESLARAEVQACFSRRFLTTEPGNRPNLYRDINVRFDMYQGGSGPNARRNQSVYRPARNVRKGKVHNGRTGPNCGYDQPGDGETAMGFPRDDCMDPECGAISDRVGKGDWDFDDYWTTNFPEVTKPNGWSNSNRPSRYQVYMHELSSGLYQSGVSETGQPICHTDAPNVPEEPDRRIIFGAIINCDAEAARLGGLQGRVHGVQPLAFGRFFLTEPAIHIANETGVYAELAGVIDPGDARPAIRPEVVLYR